MTKQPFLFLFAFMLLSASPLHAGALGLSEACQRALEYDARYRAAEAEHAVQQEETPKARSRFRPSLRMNAARGRNATESTSLVNDLSKEQYYNTLNYSIQLRQSVFNLSDLETYRQAKTVVAKSDAVLQSELSGLLVRTLDAYIDVLYASDNLEFSRAHVNTAKEQLAQAKRRFAAGFGTVTEISEAQASYDMALAEGLEFNNTLEVNRRALESMTGVYPDSLQGFVPEKMVLAVPAPHDVGQWIRLAHENSPLREAAAQDVSYFRKQIDRSRASRYPVVELVASKTFSESDNNYSIGTRYDTYAISMQMSIPLYSGGFVSSSVRQASGQLRGAYEQLSLQERTLDLDVRRYYTGIISSIAQIRAYEQAVKANEIALTGTRKGFGAGFRSNVDVLGALKNLYDSKRNLSKSRYLFVLNVIRLKDVAGVLTNNDIAAIAAWTQ